MDFTLICITISGQGRLPVRFIKPVSTGSDECFETMDPREEGESRELAALELVAVAEAVAE